MLREDDIAVNVEDEAGVGEGDICFCKKKNISSL